MSAVYLRFPGGRSKVLTLSYDDGVEQDIQLIKIMKQNGLKGTFNLNSGIYAPEGQTWPNGRIHRRLTRSASIELYKDSGMEVAVHGLTHPFLEQLPQNICTYEIMQDRANIERDFGGLVRGMAYPFGTYSDSVISSLKQCGIVYARTTQSTERFNIPNDWYRLPATCHHNNPRLMELAKKFVEEKEKYSSKFFYVWGHSYEFEEKNNWHVIEEFSEYIGNRDNVWYATNIEVYDYITAYQQLVFSMDQNTVYNPSGRELYFESNSKIHCIKSNQTINLM